MEEIMYLLGSTSLNLAIRLWMKDFDSYAVNNVLDIKKLAEKIGYSSFLLKKDIERSTDAYAS